MLVCEEPITIQRSVIYTLPPPSVHNVTQSSQHSVWSETHCNQAWPAADDRSRDAWLWQLQTLQFTVTPINDKKPSCR